MANMSDPRVPRVLAHAKACREALSTEKDRPNLPSNLQNLSGIDLTGADLTKADLTKTDLSDADLTGAFLSGANLEGADLTGADLRDAKLTGANLTGANLTGADLTRAVLRNTKLTDANLISANFTNADLWLAKIGFADLTGVKITQNQLNGAGYVDVDKEGYPKEVAEKVILLHERKKYKYSLGRKAKKRLVVELRKDGKLHIKTPIFEY